MIEKLEPFVRSGTKDRHIIISADEVLNAITEGQDIDVEYTDIIGNLDIRTINDRLDKDEYNRPIIQGNIRVANSMIWGYVDLYYARFNRHVDFHVDFGYPISRDENFLYKGSMSIQFNPFIHSGVELSLSLCYIFGSLNKNSRTRYIAVNI